MVLNCDKKGVEVTGDALRNYKDNTRLEAHASVVASNRVLFHDP